MALTKCELDQAAPADDGAGQAKEGFVDLPADAQPTAATPSPGPRPPTRYIRNAVLVKNLAHPTLEARYHILLPPTPWLIVLSSLKSGICSGITRPGRHVAGCRSDSLNGDSSCCCQLKGRALMICIQCSYRIPDALNTCPNCGRPAETVPGVPPGRTSHVRIHRQPFIDISRWTERDQIAGIASAALLISLYLPWFRVDMLIMSGTLDGLQSHGYLRIVQILCFTILGYLILRISPIRSVLPSPRAHERLMLAVTTVNLALVIVGFISTPGSAGWGPFISQQYGSFMGGIAALAAVVPLGAAVFKVTDRWPHF
jgi:hypothetical protein